jgi:hypothetical protein
MVVHFYCKGIELPQNEWTFGQNSFRSPRERVFFVGKTENVVIAPQYWSKKTIGKIINPVYFTEIKTVQGLTGKPEAY